MKKLFTILLIVTGFDIHAQKKNFRVYQDSALLVQDANQIITFFWDDLKKLSPVFTSQPRAVLNTKPFLIFYSPKSNLVNLPIWKQVVPEQQEFFYKLGGSEKNGKEMFGLFFNGFYLAHELGHAIQHAANKRESNLYQNEYFANVVAILYWKKANRTSELRKCYKYAKKMVRQLADPVPSGEDPVKFFNEHYQELGADPYKYGYFQFSQFVQIYENKSLNDFDTFIREFLTL